MIEEWIERGYRNTMPIIKVEEEIKYPEWYGDDRLHSSHRAALLAKDLPFYSKFGWNEQPALSYFWPKKFQKEVNEPYRAK